jgi:hypothetical protein
LTIELIPCRNEYLCNIAALVTILIYFLT